jgi:hypothetical protein
LFKIIRTKEKYFIFGLLFMLFLSCNFNRNKKENDIPDNSKIVNDCTQVKENVSKDVLYQFRIENLKEYGKSINSYFQTFGRGKKVYEFKCKIDTVFNENYICYDYKIGIPFSIYVFKTKEEATDFFNKLMTIELVSDFGLNKRPNHILVDSNKVFWLKMEHTYGHRMNDIKDIFRKAFDFYPTSSNLDSISGFKYCRMINIKDTTLNEIFGEWYANSFIEMDTYEYFKNSSYNGVIKPNIDTLKLKITSKSITINNDEYFYNIFGALEFPNAKYYWEYRFISTMFDNQFDQLTPEFNKKLEHLMKYCKGIKDYDISVTKNNVRFAYFTIAKTNNKEIFVTLDNRFYILKKRL